MYKILTAVFMTLCFAVAALAGSAGGSGPALGGTFINKTVITPGKGACVAVGANTLVQVDVSKTRMVDWKTFATADGSAVVMKRSFDSYSSSYMPASSETGLPIGGNVTKMNIKSYSTAGRLCVDQN